MRKLEIENRTKVLELIEREMDSLFHRVQEELGIKHGDIAPEQSLKLDECIAHIYEVLLFQHHIGVALDILEKEEFEAGDYVKSLGTSVIPKGLFGLVTEVRTGDSKQFDNQGEYELVVEYYPTQEQIREVVLEKTGEEPEKDSDGKYIDEFGFDEVIESELTVERVEDND